MKRKPLKDAFLQNAVDGNGQRLHSLSGLEIGALTRREVWFGERIATWGTAPAGSGSKDDPFDASTNTKLNAKLATVSTTSLLMFREGEFDWSGNAVWAPGAGAAIIGAGRDATILRRADTTSTHLILGTGDGITVEGLTLDNGSQDRVGATSVAVQLYGNKNTIRNVLVRNTRSAGNEYFNLAIFCSGTSTVDGLIEHCISEDSEGYATQIGLFYDSSDYDATVTGSVLYCTVRRCESNAFGAAGTKNALFMGNKAYGAYYGFNYDSGIGDNLKLIANEFIDCVKYGVVILPFLLGPSAENVIVESNLISIAPDTAQSNIAGILAGNPSSSAHTLVKPMFARNAIIYEPSGDPVGLPNSVNIQHTTGLRCFDNEASDILRASLSDNTGARFRDNTYEDGTPWLIYGTDEPIEGNVLTSDVPQLATVDQPGRISARDFTLLSGLGRQVDGSVRVAFHHNGAVDSTILEFIDNSDYTFGADDIIEFDVFHASANPAFAGHPDFRLTGHGLAGDFLSFADQDGVALRNSNPAAIGAWYRRYVAVPADAIGWVVTSTIFRVRAATSGDYAVYLRDMRITRAGALRRIIYDGAVAPLGTVASGGSNLDSHSVMGGYHPQLSTGSALMIGGEKVVGTQGAAVANATDAASAITQLNLLLARARAHGLIAT